MPIISNTAVNWIVDGANVVKSAWRTWCAEVEDAVENRTLPTGGSTGQALKKVSGSDHDVEWGTVTSLSAPANNRLLNGAMRINQRGAATAADDAYCFDRWYALTQSGTVAVSAQTNIEAGWPNALRLTQSQATAQRFGLAQIVESANCIDLRSQDVVLAARVRCSASTTLRFAVLEWTGTADSVTSDVVHDWTNVSYAAGGFFLASNVTVSAVGSLALTANTPADVELAATLGASANNVVVMFWTESTQAQNVTLDIGKAQFTKGTAAVPFEPANITDEIVACRRYYQVLKHSAQCPKSGTQLHSYNLSPQMRATPTAGIVSTGTTSNASVVTRVGGLDFRGAYFQITATVDGGYVLGEITSYDAEL